VIARHPAVLQALHPGITVAGPFTNQLSNRGERIVLKDANNNPADVVGYYDGGRRPNFADGGARRIEPSS